MQFSYLCYLGFTWVLYTNITFISRGIYYASIVNSFTFATFSFLVLGISFIDAILFQSYFIYLFLWWSFKLMNNWCHYLVIWAFTFNYYFLYSCNWCFYVYLGLTFDFAGLPIIVSWFHFWASYCYLLEDTGLYFEYIIEICSFIHMLA